MNSGGIQLLGCKYRGSPAASDEANSGDKIIGGTMWVPGWKINGRRNY